MSLSSFNFITSRRLHLPSISGSKPLTRSSKLLCDFTRSAVISTSVSQHLIYSVYSFLEHAAKQKLADVRNWLQTGWQDTHPVFHQATVQRGREKRLMINHLPHCNFLINTPLLAGGECKGYKSDTLMRWMYGIKSKPPQAIWDYFKAPEGMFCWMI